MKIEPTNVACLAAELARCNPDLSTYRAASLATELCCLGRRWTRLAERLCGGEEEWGRYPEAGKRMTRAERSQAHIYEQIETLLRPWHAELNDNEGGSLHLAVTSRYRGTRETTVLR